MEAVETALESLSRGILARWDSGLHGQLNAVADLGAYFPFLAIGVHAAFCAAIVFQCARLLLRRPPWTASTHLGRLHSKAALLCLVAAFIAVPFRWPPRFSSPLYVSDASDALAWLLIAIALQREAASGRALFSGILTAWWIAILSLSPVSLAVDVVSGQSMLAVARDVLIFVVSLVLVVLAFKGEQLYSGDGRADGLKAPFLSEDSENGTSSGSCGGGYGEARALSLLTFSWLNALLTEGSKKPLSISDIPALDHVDDLNKSYEDFWNTWTRQRVDRQPGSPSPSIWMTLLETFWRPFVAIYLLGLLWTAAMFVGPVMQNLLINFMEEENRKFSQGIGLVLILLTGKFVEAFSTHHLSFRARQLGLRMWAGVGCAVYRKCIRLSLKARQVRGVGEITNLVSADVQRLLELTYYVQQGIVLPVQVFVAVTVLFYVVGVAMVAGLSSLAVVLVLNSFIVGKMRQYRAKLLVGKDKRMRTTVECLGNMKVIKLQAWDEMFKERIVERRAEEYKWVRKFMFIWANAIHMVWNGPFLVSGVTFLTMVLIGEPLTTARVFTAITTIRIMQEPIRFLPDVVANVIQAAVSLQRIRLFLMEDEVEEAAVERVPWAGSQYAVELQGASFSWDRWTAAPALQDVDLKVDKGACVAICGGVGSGKSSLLYCIAGELHKLAGTAKLAGRVAYVAQSAWIQNDTIRENVLFGRAMDSKRYREALRVAGLEADLAQLPDRDDTEIGERGTTLSGGQKQRIQLARAVYQDADVYLLDDPFSAVDAHTGTFLFEECVKGALKNKTVILVTHQVEFLPAVDLIIVMKAPGEIVQAGTYRELVHEGKDFGAFVDALQESLQNVTRATHANADEEDEEGADGMESSSDSSDMGVPLVDSSSVGNVLLTEQLAKLGSRSSSLRKSESWKASSEGSGRGGRDRGESTRKKLIEEEMRETGRVDNKVIKAYITKVGGGFLFWLIFVPQVTTVVCQTSSDLWLAYGTSSGKSSLPFILVYISLLLACSMSVLARTKLVAYFGVTTAQAFFTGMIDSILRAPMSFFDSTPLGRILSRSATDQTALDLELPTTVASISNSLIAMTGTLLITIYVTKPVIFLIVPLGFVYFRLQRFYISSARELSRLTALSEAPLYLHISESIAGITTIRAFEEQSRFADTNEQRLETYQRAYFHNLTASEWLGLRLDSIAASVLSFAALLLLSLPEGAISAGLAGMSLSYGLSLSGVLMRLMVNISTAENKMVSVERIRQYSDLPSEAPAVLPDHRPQPDWPEAGRIDLQELQLRYRPDTPLVLKGLSCVINPREKVGVVGRTGSGKSTLIQALFRLVEPAGGRILIDGLDITTVGLNDLRSALGVIPQEPTLFEGTVRSNMDPFNLCSDQEIWESLDKCQLGPVMRAKPEKLQAPVSEQGENWSVGERQLLCLGRALLRRARVLVLDEATASVDITTDAIIQRVIKTYFAGSTVISVAHRIPTVIDSDRVLVLDNGHLKENDSPEHLLANENSMFSKLVQEYTQRTNTHH